MIAIKASNLGKTYKLYKKPWDSLNEWLFRRSKHENIVALEGIDFELLQGETMGIVGDNGAGKSTLLKLLAGTISPSHGIQECNGRKSVILELGSGFHPEFSGRDNAEMGCALLGLSRHEIKTAIPEIEQFLELCGFFDKPVKTYSSGMYVRLAFSVVTSVDPDILIVDEALSVGDQHFQRKCMNRMRVFRDQGKTIIFCSHNLYQIKELCKKALWLDQGKMVQYGNALEVVDNYQDAIRQRDVVSDGLMTKKHKPITETYIIDTVIQDRQGGELFNTGGVLKIAVTVDLGSVSVDDAHIGIVIMRNDNIHCYGVSTQIDQAKLTHLNGTIYSVTLVLDPLQLLSGKYYFCVYLLDGDGVHIYDYREEVCHFVVRHQTKEVGVSRLQHEWM